MKPIIRWSFWQRRFSTMWWSIASFGLIFINMIFYPSFKDQAAELQKSFESLPEATVQFIGGSTDFFSPIGFLNSQIFFLMVPLLLGILAIGLGSSLLAREEQDMTVEVVLARPVSRTMFITAKALVGVGIVTAVSVITTVVVMVLSRIVDIPVALPTLAAVMVLCWLLVVSFGAVAFAVTSLGKARGASIGIAAFFALGGYIISSLVSTVGWLAWPAKLLPFHYYQSEAVLRGAYNWANALYFVGLIAVCAAISWYGFNRRDLG